MAISWVTQVTMSNTLNRAEVHVSRIVKLFQGEYWNCLLPIFLNLSSLYMQLCYSHTSITIVFMYLWSSGQFITTDPAIPDSIAGATRFSE
jgi:hypothetical protein